MLTTKNATIINTGEATAKNAEYANKRDFPVFLSRISRFLLLVLCVLGLSGCRHAPPEAANNTVHVEGGPHYQHLFGQRYRTKVDLYLFAFSGDAEAKYLGRNDGRFPYLDVMLPADVSSSHIGDNGSINILDVVPSGSEFSLAAETHEITTLSGMRDKGGLPLGFICRLAYNNKQFNDVLAEFIQTADQAPHGTPNQRIDANIAEKIQ